MTTVGADGRYRLLRCLGRGGMGEVHLAVARGAAGFEKLVAIKFLDEQGVEDRELSRALLREAFLGVQLDHEHIVSVLDLGEDARRYFVVMEYVRGFTLGHVLSHLDAIGEAMPVGVALHVARATIDAVEYLHRARIVHGDVSPSNVLLAHDGRIKLADFGIATFAGARSSGDGATIAGKLSYLPPEAFAHVPRGPTWDTYAVAALVYEAIAGVPAFPAASLDAVRNALRKGVPPLTGHRPDVPSPLADVIEHALAFHPDRRLSSLAELRAELDAVAPRQLGDAEAHRALVARVYEDPGFVARHGELPTTGGHTLDTEPRVAEAVTTTDVSPRTEGRVRSRALRFGVSPAMGAARARATSERFTAFLSAKLGREIRPVVLADYAMLVACLVQGEIDLAWMPPTSFVSAVEHGAGVLAKIRRTGRTTYTAAIIARADSGIETLDQLRGKTVAWVDQDSASGYLFPAAELRRVLGDPATALGEQSFLGSHQAVCDAVLKGWADAGATYASRDADGVVSSGWNDHLGERARSIVPLWFSTPIPGDSIAHRPFLPEPLRDTLTRTLTELSETEIGRTLLLEVFNAEALVAADVRDYEGVREALGLV